MPSANGSHADSTFRQSLETKSSAFRSMSDTKLVSRTFIQWTTTWTGQLLLHSRSLKLIRSCLSTWVERTCRITIDLDARCEIFLRKGGEKIVEGCWEQWREAQARRIRLDQIARRTADTTIVRRTFRTWRTRLDELELNERKADVAREFFLQRQVWNAWTARVQKRKADRWVLQRVKASKSEVFHCKYDLDLSSRTFARLTALSQFGSKRRKKSGMSECWWRLSSLPSIL